MTEITFEIYGKEAEITSYTHGSAELLLRFTEPIE